MHYLSRTQTVDESDATTLTAFCSGFVMPSWRVMLTSQRGDEQATAASYSPVQLLYTATSSKQRLLTEVLGGGMSPYCTYFQTAAP
eukprot:scaffold4270_cov161-Skeletonema_dohrnii-CCMP3373.AAC.2